MKTIAIGNDHAGTSLKFFIKEYFSNAIKWIDFGTAEELAVDYPDYVHPLAEAVESGTADSGILICGSGNGVCMTANKHQGIRAALCWTAELGVLARRHNNANVLCLPARFIDQSTALKIVEAFFKTDFEGGRHQKRVDKIRL
jgi:ribose 5-phosphate isomerase B